jgi:parvulin-like peptidyl-prolyl isomerase
MSVVDRTVKCGKMTLDIMDYTEHSIKCRDSRSMSRIRQGVWLLLAFAALLLAGCGGDDAPGQSATADTQPTIEVAAVTSTQEPSAPAATEESPTATPTVTPPAPLAAIVNGQYVFLADYEQRVAQYEEALFEQGIDPNTEEGQEHLRDARRDVLEGMIDTVLIEQEAPALGITLVDEELEAQVQSDIATGGGQAAFDEWLQITGLTRDDYKAMLRQAMISQRVLEAVTADVGGEAEQVHVRHIMVDSEEAALEIQTMLQEGADFVALARERSLDLATKDNGGDLGWFPRGMVAVELENAAFALQPGQISAVIRLGEGYHIIQLVEREVAYPLSPEVQLDLRLAVFDEWLAAKRGSAAIERFVGE